MVEQDNQAGRGGRWPLVGVCAAVAFVFCLAFAYREGARFDRLDPLLFGTIPGALGGTAFLIGVPALASYFVGRRDEGRWRSSFIGLFVFLLALNVFARVFLG